MNDVNRQVVERLESAVLLTDDAGTVLFGNERALALLGRDLTGACLGTATFDDDSPLLIQVADLFRRAQSGAGHELIAATDESGSHFYWASVSASTVSNGRLISLLDISAPLMESPGIRRVFSQVNHDLRSPLTSIGGAAGLLLSGRVGRLEPAQARLLGIVEEGTRRMTEILARTRTHLGEAGATGGGNGE